MGFRGGTRHETAPNWTRWDSDERQRQNPRNLVLGYGFSDAQVEPDIDYYTDVGANALLEVIPNFFTGGLTDSKAVYVLRWIAGRRTGVPEFDPPYTIVAYQAASTGEESSLGAFHRYLEICPRTVRLSLLKPRWAFRGRLYCSTFMEFRTGSWDLIVTPLTATDVFLAIASAAAFSF